jgi:hypothetical protein
MSETLYFNIAACNLVKLISLVIINDHGEAWHGKLEDISERTKQFLRGLLKQFGINSCLLLSW